MNYLFWNVNKNKRINNVIKDVIIDNDCDVIALAEYEDDLNSLIKDLYSEGYNFYPLDQIGCKRIQIITKFKPKQIKFRHDRDKYTIKTIPHETHNEINIVFLHLQSKTNDEHDEARAFELLNIKNNLEKIEEQYDNKKSIIVGDFNMNPFERPMVSASGIHSLSSSNETLRGKRTVGGYDFSMFYNPMWNFLGDRCKPEGTYYYSKSQHVNYFWNIFDQVVIRPELVEYFDMEKLKIITNVGSISLLNKNGKPNKQISDHLPLFFNIC